MKEYGGGHYYGEKSSRNRQPLSKKYSAWTWAISAYSSVVGIIPDIFYQEASSFGQHGGKEGSVSLSKLIILSLSSDTPNCP